MWYESLPIPEYGCTHIHFHTCLCWAQAGLVNDTGELGEPPPQALVPMNHSSACSCPAAVSQAPREAPARRAPSAVYLEEKSDQQKKEEVGS